MPEIQNEKTNRNAAQAAIKRTSEIKADAKRRVEEVRKSYKKKPGVPKTLKYPLEELDYKARVIFSVVADKATGGGDFFSAQTKKLQADLQACLKRQKELDQEIEDQFFSGTETKKLRQQENLEKEIRDKLKAHQGNASKNTAKKDTIAITQNKISLYLPMGLAFRDNVTYENFDLGAVGAGMEQGLNFAESMVKGLGSFISNLSGDAASPDLAKLAGVQLATKAGSFGSEIAAAGKIAGGVTLNPNSRILFKQPNIREFMFTFKMIARSEEEANEIDNIIKTFRTELYPDEINANVGEASISLGYKFPNKFNIAFEYDGDDIKGLAKIKPCYLRDVSTTYNASQMGMHADGHFMEVDMTLSFQETRALVRKDVEVGGF